MFTILQLRDSQPVNQKYQKCLRDLLNKFSLTTEGLWLRTLKLDQVDFMWCNAMQGTDVLGAFCPTYSNKIFMQPPVIQIQQSQDVIDQLYMEWIYNIFTTIVHQLRHMYQWRKNKFSYTLASLPLLRQVTLQKDAQRAQIAAQLFAQKENIIRNQKRGIAKGYIQEVSVGSDSNA